KDRTGQSNLRRSHCTHPQSRYPIELKLWRGEKALKEGLEQTARYMNVYGCAEGWLALFDRRLDRKWDDKIYMRKETVGTQTITVVGL
ncbi:MAG: hypothetical protein LBQ65_09740, partial [Tannerellaceae bacterium]|nr:hypothetical protein [Tannerellaceae bacterium]